ncbi:hypothetical protein BVRB_036920 [Beta vulgaris subsp. vulgaris]|uniref:Uncharacterized protein n=1 Tax=Beta vulgaris subsp. vulgaris TaxID=3555 RepID=A0A0J7YP34_BETVV|nr:hypothetical protein BVRB_036920 [Beta vulgaris subsp. vulgaris]
MKSALAKWATASTKSLNSLVGGDSAGSESQGGGGARNEASPRGRTNSEVTLIADMDTRFYLADFDSVGTILGQLAPDCSDRDLENCLQTYDNLLCVVKGQLSSQIFANYNEFGLSCFFCCVLGGLN